MVIDSGRLPVISADRRQSAHVAVLPNKRTTGKSCAEAAQVFAVRVRDSRFGKTHGYPAVVDSVPPDPTVRSSESAEVDLESVDVYHCASV